MDDNCHHQDFCYHHPNQALLGVCPFCLNDKLVAVAAKQLRCRQNHHQEEAAVSRTSTHSRKPSNVGLTKILAFGSFINRLEILHHHRNRRETYECDEDGAAAASDIQSTSSSLEDSFISIKFEENGVPLWDKSKVLKASDQENQGIFIKACDAANKEGYFGENGYKSVVVEHTKTTGRGSLRWRKRISHLFQLVRWKRSSKANGVAGIVKVRNRGWIRTLTRTRTSKESTQA